MHTVGFEYKKKKSETPFETFLRYTNEKERSAAKLAEILQKILHDHSDILDIGAGNGEYLELALTKMKMAEEVILTLVEPSEDLFEQLRRRLEQRFPDERLKTVNANLQSFVTDEQFDVILMSHLFYHVPELDRTEQLAKALSLLKPTGVLIIVLCEKDDAYDFKMAFKPQLFGESFQALTINDVLDALPKGNQLQIAKYQAASELKIPFQENLDDTISIIEFYLDKPWSEMPQAIRDGALDFIKEKEGILKQLDGIAVIRRSK